MKLFLVVLGGKPAGRLVEQHDVCFALGESIEDTLSTLKAHWPEAGHLHIDSYMAVEEVDGFKVQISGQAPPEPDMKLFFINLGGYQAGDMEEHHKKLLIAASDIHDAKKRAKTDVFFEGGYVGLGAAPHVDDRMPLNGFDVDDVLLVDEQLPPEHFIHLTPDESARFAKNERFPCYRMLRD